MAPGLTIKRIPAGSDTGSTLRLISGLTGSRTLAKLTIPGRRWRHAGRMAFVLAAWSPPAGRQALCLRLKITATDRRGKRIGRVGTSYTCLNSSEWTWLGLRTTTPAGAAAVHVHLERRSANYTRIELMIAGAPRAKTSRVSPPVPPPSSSPAAPPPPLSRPKIRPPPGPIARPLTFLPRDFRLDPALKRPRILLTDAALPRYRALARGQGRVLFGPLRDLADRFVAEKIPGRPFAASRPGPDYGRRPLLLAFCHRITGDKKYFDAARRWALAISTWRDWGRGRSANQSLIAAHLLSDLAVTYDWLAPSLPPEERRIIRLKIVLQAELLHQALTKPGGAWWNQAWRHGRLWIGATALGLAGLALSGDVPRAEAWVRAALDTYRRINTVLPADGSWPEAAAHWGEAVGAMTVFYLVLQATTNVDPWPTCPWLAKTVLFRLYNSRPDWRGVLNFGDGPERDRAGYQLEIIARAYQLSLARWLALRTINPGDAYGLWGFLAADPDLKPTPPDDFPLFRLFADIELFVVRGSWGPKSTLIAFKAGPPGGRRNAQARLVGRRVFIGRCHPDQNSFVVLAGGRGLIVDDGPTALKWTRDQNTLLVNGRGQRGEGLEVFHDDRPEDSLKIGLKVVLATPFLAVAEGEAATAYPPDLGLQSYRRLILFLPPDLVIVRDRALTAAEASFSQRFHFRGRLRQATRPGAYDLVSAAGDVVLAARFLSPRGVHFETTPYRGKVNGRQVRQTVLAATNTDRARRFSLMAVLRPGAGPSALADLTPVKNGDVWGWTWALPERRMTFLTRARTGPLSGPRLAGRARDLFCVQDQGGNFVAVGLAGRSLIVSGKKRLEAAADLDWTVLGRAQVMVALFRVSRDTRVTLFPGFVPQRVSVGESVLSPAARWAQKRVTVQLAPGARWVILRGPRAPRLPPQLSPGSRNRWLFAR